ncbi:phospholipase D-like domain-containing protein [Pseudorhodoferax sp.]|uniref:phospholipase D-like domain-containing protein n=1 Tax=Pseudorhodoferax sp. TaxID=1993553 RepID=UPI002DD66D61|nr:phospholipase D family protein [Pseudorhodoferax sp.]
MNPTPWLRAARLAALAALAWLLQACAQLPRPDALAHEPALATTPDAPLARLAAQAPAPGLSGFRLLPGPAFAFDARLTLAREARHALDLQYYLFRGDAPGRALLRALREAAARGVRVRLLVDDLHIDRDDALLLAFAAQPNVQVRVFNPLAARGGGLGWRLLRSLPELRRINKRMHNKLFIADGVASVSGGRNIGAEYFMHDEDANFIDLDILSLGPVVQAQSASFDRYWNSAHSWPLARLAQTTAPPPGDPLAGPPLRTTGLPLDPLDRGFVSDEIAAGRLALFWAPAEVWSDLPEKIDGASMAQRFAGSVTERIVGAIAASQSSVLLVSPYFIPGDIGLDLMRGAHARGVRTLVLTNSLGATDEALVHFAYAQYRERMLQLGVELYEMGAVLSRRLTKLGNFGRSEGRLHAKLAVFDDRRLFIGSTNLDERSASLNTEVGLLIDSPELVRDFKRLMDGDGERFRGAWRVRLDAAGRLQWVEHDEDGTETVLDGEPGVTPLIRLKRWLLTPLIPEELL